MNALPSDPIPNIVSSLTFLLFFKSAIPKPFVHVSEPRTTANVSPGMWRQSITLFTNDMTSDSSCGVNIAQSARKIVVRNTDVKNIFFLPLFADHTQCLLCTIKPLLRLEWVISFAAYRIYPIYAEWTILVNSLDRPISSRRVKCFCVLLSPYFIDIPIWEIITAASDLGLHCLPMSFF